MKTMIKRVLTGSLLACAFGSVAMGVTTARFDGAVSKATFNTAQTLIGKIVVLKLDDVLDVTRDGAKAVTAAKVKNGGSADLFTEVNAAKVAKAFFQEIFITKVVYAAVLDFIVKQYGFNGAVTKDTLFDGAVATVGKLAGFSAVSKEATGVKCTYDGTEHTININEVATQIADVLEHAKNMITQCKELKQHLGATYLQGCKVTIDGTEYNSIGAYIKAQQDICTQLLDDAFRRNVSEALDVMARGAHGAWFGNEHRSQSAGALGVAFGDAANDALGI